MDSNNSDVEEEFPGLYAPAGSKNKKDETERTFLILIGSYGAQLFCLLQ